MHPKTASRVSQVIYFLLGIILVTGGAIALFSPQHLVPEIATSFTENAQYIRVLQDDLMHLSQELGAAFVGLGCVLVWAIFNHEKFAQLITFFYSSLCCLQGSIGWNTLQAIGRWPAHSLVRYLLH